MLKNFSHLSFSYDAIRATLDGGTVSERRLSQLGGCFFDPEAYEQALGREDSLVYRVTALEPADGPGNLHCGLGVLYPGKIGDEYYLTKGHYHERREAAEFYVGLSGNGVMLLEDEKSGASRLEKLGAGTVVYVPGHTAHRTINIGSEPLTYFGIYPADAGHDYGAIADRNFHKVVVDRSGVPTMLDRR